MPFDAKDFIYLLASDSMNPQSLLIIAMVKLCVVTLLTLNLRAAIILRCHPDLCPTSWVLDI